MKSAFTHWANLEAASDDVISKMKSSKVFGLVDKLSSLVLCTDCEGLVVKNVRVSWQHLILYLILKASYGIDGAISMLSSLMATPGTLTRSTASGMRITTTAITCAR